MATTAGQSDNSGQTERKARASKAHAEASPPVEDDMHTDAAAAGAETSGADAGEPPDINTLGLDAGAEDSEDPRRVAHELLGQAHAVLAIAADERVLKVWCPAELRDAVRAAHADLAEAIGRAHAEVAGGEHDERLRGNGIGGVHGKVKRWSFRAGLRRLKQAVDTAGDWLQKDRQTQVRALLRFTAGTAKSVVQSVLEGTTVGHALVEGFELIQNGLDLSDAIVASATPPDDVQV
jgi:hypothetical protein